MRITHEIIICCINIILWLIYMTINRVKGKQYEDYRPGCSVFPFIYLLSITDAVWSLILHRNLILVIVSILIVLDIGNVLFNCWLHIHDEDSPPPGWSRNHIIFIIIMDIILAIFSIF